LFLRPSKMAETDCRNEKRQERGRFDHHSLPSRPSGTTNL
jgi:hypothetical protein